jgi:hypothetical protein
VTTTLSVRPLFEAEDLGRTPVGDRRVVNILGGSFRGERLAGPGPGGRFETADPALEWLNRILALGIGARRPRAVQLRAFEVL